MAGTVTTTKTASWGVTTAIGADSPVTGVVTDYDDACEPVLAPEQNEVGSTINQTMYDKHYTCSFTVQVAASTAKPDAGSAITVGGKTWYVTSARITENNNSYRKIALQAERYVHCDATEAASGITTGA
jgi:hypothetical protein